MKGLRRFAAIASVMLVTVGAQAYDFESGGFYYEVISGTKKVKVVGDALDHSTYKDLVVVPSEVTYNSEKYSVTAIGAKAFVRSQAVSVQIPEGVTEIGDSTFYFSDKLQNITLPQSVRTISRAAFAGTAIKDVVVPEGVTVLGNGAFQSCSQLHTVYLPSTLKTIESYGFNNCNNLAEIYCKAEATPAATGWAIFIGLSDIDVIVPDKSVSNYKSTSPWSDETTFSIYPSEDVEASVQVTGHAADGYDELSLGEHVAYKIYYGDELVAITAAEKYYLPSDGKTYKIVPTNTFSDAVAMTYKTTNVAGLELPDDEVPLNIFTDGDAIYVESGGDNTEGWVIEVYDASGAIVYKAPYTSDTSITGLPAGKMYIVRCDDVVKKVILF